MVSASQLGSRVLRAVTVAPFAHFFSGRTSGRWLQRTNRRSIILFLLCSEILGSAYILACGLNFSHIPGFHREMTKSPWRISILLCGVGRRTTCIVDGDTGWESGRKWRLLNVEAPALITPACRAEYDRGLQARDRLIALMREGYRVAWTGRNDRYGRALVEIELSNGASASQVLLNEGLAQGWPYFGNIWCGQ
jgi:endonuclease YncB( thermonuclease family)